MPIFEIDILASRIAASQKYGKKQPRKKFFTKTLDKQHSLKYNKYTKEKGVRKMKQAYTTKFLFDNSITYAAIPKDYLKNKELSIKAKGLLTIIYSLPDEWEYNMKGLEKVANLTEKTLRKLLDEIMQQGYIHRSKQQDKRGRFYYTYTVFPKQVPNEIWI